MDIGGINRIKPALASLFQLSTKNTRPEDRDPNGSGGYQHQDKPKHLTQDQEDEALKKHNSLPAFSKSGLIASIVRVSGIVTHIVVKD